MMHDAAPPMNAAKERKTTGFVSHQAFPILLCDYSRT
jgi:hypothetical protein